MKPILLLFLLLFTGEQDPLTDLTGKWKLIKIDVNGIMVTPQKHDHYLNISKNSITYNRDVNQCRVDSFFVDTKNITLYNCACTKIAEHDEIIKYLNYSGTYQLQDSLLTIFNSKEILYLKKIH